MLESKLQERCMQMIRHAGGYVYKNAASMYTEVGRPDLTACIPVTLQRCIDLLCNKDAYVGLFVGIELKRPGNLKGLTKAQEIVGRKIANASGLWYAIDSSNTLQNILDHFTGGSDAR